MDTPVQTPQPESSITPAPQKTLNVKSNIVLVVISVIVIAIIILGAAYLFRKDTPQQIAENTNSTSLSTKTRPTMQLKQPSPTPAPNINVTNMVNSIDQNVGGINPDNFGQDQLSNL